MNFSLGQQFDLSQFKAFGAKNNFIHNILMIVGNGFDISVLNHLGASGSTTYQSFFYYLKSIGFHKKNSLFEAMDSLRQQCEGEADPKLRKSNWSDFEERLDEMLATNAVPTLSLERDLAEIQAEFSAFLNRTVDANVLNSLNEEVTNKEWSIKTFESFLKDLPKEEYEKTALPLTCNHYDIFNFDVVNLNFTPLLDCYLYLDRLQHRPQKKTVDRNFNFDLNRNNFLHSTEIIADLESDYPERDFFRPDKETNCSGYLTTNLCHPHGQQDIPRSLLFGVDGEGTAKDGIDRTRFAKSYWAQLDRKFLSKIDSAQTFILFGTSLGATDHWWWKNILRSAYKNKYGDIIIYKYEHSDSTAESKDEFRDSFIISNLPEELKEDFNSANEALTNLRRKTHIVLYSDASELNAFGFKTEE